MEIKDRYPLINELRHRADRRVSKLGGHSSLTDLIYRAAKEIETMQDEIDEVALKLAFNQRRDH